ncbi:hypothetical protein CEXT_137381 [Caerostris extrusa]|uniref:Uncharacterized protein n=1 Tax=Caerostris extrusa TaxID=172846 RepID=A0AAV4WH68_CAEEX|nr:hypothetical protein CEXT_137381 [Caerostris extrusa]
MIQSDLSSAGGHHEGDEGQERAGSEGDPSEGQDHGHGEDGADPEGADSEAGESDKRPGKGERRGTEPNQRAREEQKSSNGRVPEESARGSSP